jgi:hypothetical protein
VIPNALISMILKLIPALLNAGGGTTFMANPRTLKLYFTCIHALALWGIHLTWLQPNRGRRQKNLWLFSQRSFR